MKNIRRNRLPALLLAVVMVIGILPAVAVANVSNTFILGMTYSYDATETAAIRFESDGNEVTNIADLDPNKASMMTISVPDSNALPADKKGETVVNVPENIIVTAENMKATQSNDVVCSYRASTNQLVFKWNGERKAGFTATIPFTPNAPVTGKDVSGNWLLVIKNKNGQLIVVKPELKVFDGINRLTANEGQLINGMIYRAGTNFSEWKITRLTGDWYSISNGSQYINYGKNGNNISLSDKPQYFRYARYGAGDQFVGYDEKGTRYYLNNKSNNANNGIQASTYDDQSILLYHQLKAPAGTSLVSFNVNGGSADNKLTPVLMEEGASVKLPEYKGTKKGARFIGWATRGNLKQNTFTQVYQPGETLTVESDDMVMYAAWTSEKPERSQFGIRMSGDIPDEPAQYDVGAYSKQHVYIDGTVITGTWVVDTNADGQAIQGNHVVNAVTANLNKLPTDDEIKTMYPNYNPDTMYVHWYVLKYAGGMWKVDGVIVERNQQVEVRYDANVATEMKAKIKNIPAAYKVSQGTTVTIGIGVDGKKMKLPEYPEYIFAGWNTKADGSGEAYDSNTTFEVNENTIFYAQWTKIPTYAVSYELNERETEQYHAGDKVELPEAEDKDYYIFGGWMMNGEPIKGSEIIVPDHDVVISKCYYGPIDVEIVIDWPDGMIGYKGATIKLTAVIKTQIEENLDYTYQWQYRDSDGNWANYQDPTPASEITYELNEETSARVWRVLVVDAKPHQD